MQVNKELINLHTGWPLTQVNKFLIDLHTRRPLTQSNYTRNCINTVVFLRMSTELLKTCRRFK